MTSIPASLTTEIHEGLERAVEPRPRRKAVSTMMLTVVLLLLAEGAVRMRAYLLSGSGSPVADIYDPDPVLGRRLRAGAELIGSRRAVHIGQAGFRRTSTKELDPAEGAIVAVLGDSTSFGMEASSDEATWPGRLEQRLRSGDVHASRHGSHVQVLNGGVPGYSVGTSLAQFRRDITPCAPTIVVIYHAASDIATASRASFAPRTADRPSDTGRERLQRSSLLYNLIRVNVAGIFTENQSQTITRHDRLDDASVALFRTELTRLIDTCTAAGSAVVLCTYPRAFERPGEGDDAAAGSALAHNAYLTQQGLADAYDRYNEAIRCVARERKLPLADLDEGIPRSPEYFADSVHFNDAGHERAGRLVAETLRALPAALFDAHDAPEAPAQQPRSMAVVESP